MKRRDWLKTTVLAPILAFLGVKAKPEFVSEATLPEWEPGVGVRDEGCVFMDKNGDMWHTGPFEWERRNMSKDYAIYTNDGRLL